MTSPRQRSRGAVLLTGLLSLLGILVILVGLPVALVVLGGNPLPSQVPSWDEVVWALSRPDDGTLLIGIITVVGWVVWASLALSFLLEVPSAIRGVPAPRLPGLSWQQGRAAAMVGAVAAMIALGTAAAAPAGAAQTGADGPASTTAATSTAVNQQLDADSGARAGVVADDASDRATPSDGVAGEIVEVRSGDTLWGIAEAELGDGERYPELFEASADHVQPGDQQLTSADHIQPGWQVMVPTPTEASAPQETPAPEQGPVTDVTAPSDGATGVADDLDEQMGGSGGADASGSTTAAPPPAPTSSPAPGDRGQAGIGAFATTGLGLMAGAGVLALVEARRRRRLRGRRPGWRLVAPSEAAQRAERWVAALADTRGHADLEAALGDLAVRCTGGELPSLRAARLGESEIELYVVEESQQLPAPWVSAGAGTWVLDRHRITPLGAATVTPWPALVTIGEDEDGGRIFINLEQIGALELLGDQDETRSVLAALVVDLATADPGHARVTVVGAMDDLVAALDEPHVTHSPNIQPVLERLEATGSMVGRGEAVVIGTGLGSDEVARLRVLLAAAPRGALSVVCTTTGVAEWSLTVRSRHEGLSAVLAPVGMPLRPAALTHPGYAELLELLRSTSPTHEQGPAWTAPSYEDPLTAATLPRRRVSSSDAEERTVRRTSRPGSDHSAQVTVLGPVQVTGPGRPPRDEERAVELAALLALHPGSDTAGAAASLGVPVETLAWIMQGFEAWLGAPGRPALVPDGGGHALGDADVDWQRLRDLIGPAVATADSADMRQALELVTGAPFDGVAQDRYTWARGDRWEISAAVADIAHELAQRSLREGDPVSARWAARKGLLAEPVNEALWRDVLHAAWQAEDPERARSAAMAAQAALGDLGGLAEETTRVMADLAATVPRSS